MSESKNICENLGLEVEFEKVGGFDPVKFDEKCVSAVRDASEKLGYSHMNIISGAGHDACQMSHVVPTGMIFIPCKDGISHNEIESAEPEHISAGANVLLDAMLQSAG